MRQLQVILLFALLFPCCIAAQGHKGTVESCAPMKNGKVCYSDETTIDNRSRDHLFDAINGWAKENFGKDYFLSNYVHNKAKGTININSKYELLLNDSDSTIIKFKLRITCFDNRYRADITDISYVYNPDGKKKFRTYKAEQVIADNGKGNKVEAIQDPTLFCNATFFFAQNILADIFSAAKGEEKSD